jgi:hypothetical protein
VILLDKYQQTGKMELVELTFYCARTTCSLKNHVKIRAVKQHLPKAVIGWEPSCKRMLGFWGGETYFSTINNTLYVQCSAFSPSKHLLGLKLSYPVYINKVKCPHSVLIFIFNITRLQCLLKIFKSRNKFS